MKRLPTKIFVVCAVVLTANIWSLPASSADRDVTVEDTSYTPVVIQANQQDTVRWTSRSNAPHTVTHQSSNPTFDSHKECNPPAVDSSKCMGEGDQYSVAITGTGDIPYYCKIHGKLSPAPDPSKPATAQPCGMCGLIDVTDQQINPTPTPVPTPRPTHPQQPPPPTSTPFRFGNTPTPAVTDPAGVPVATGPSPSLGLPATPTPSSSATPAGDAGSFGAPEEDERGEGGGAGRAVAIVAGIGALAAAGGLAWYSLLRR